MLLRKSTVVNRVFALSATGVTVTIQLSKNGAALANPSAGASTLTELAHGLYVFALTATDTNAAGSLAYALYNGATLYTPPDCQDTIVPGLPGDDVISTGTASAGGASTITLATALGANSLPNGCQVKITGGTGAGQARNIIGYVNGTLVATVDVPWTTAPDNTSVYVVTYNYVSALLNTIYGTFENGTAQAGGTNTVTLRSGASSVTDFFKNQAIYIFAGTGAGQTNTITGYNGSTKVATVETAWATQPDSTSQYLIIGRVG